MTSLVYWTLLGLVIERPSYGQELYNRFERKYGDVVRLSGASHVYGALDSLEERTLIERIPGTGPDRATQDPLQGHLTGDQQLPGMVMEQFVAAQRHSQELWVRQFSVFASDPDTALCMLVELESQHLKEAERTGHSAGAPIGSRAEMIDDLVSERQRLAEGGLLKWLQYAQDRFEALRRRGPTTMTLLELQSVSKRYRGGERVALDDVSLMIDAGEMVTVWGERRSGRSTLLRVAAVSGRLIPASSGSLGETWRAAARRCWATGSATVVERFVHPRAEISLISWRQVSSRAAYRDRQHEHARGEALERVAAKECATRTSEELNGEEIVRVAIARALACEPRLLVIDEPTIGVDLARAGWNPHSAALDC